MKKQRPNKTAPSNPRSQAKPSRARSGSKGFPASWWFYLVLLILAAVSVAVYQRGGWNAVIGKTPQTNQTMTGTEPPPPAPFNPGASNTGSATPEQVPDDPIELIEIGNAFLAQKQHARAIPYFNKAIQSDIEDEEVHFNLGFAYSKIGMTNLAIQNYTESLRIFPEYAEAHNNLGNIYVSLKKFSLATEHFSASLESNPENPSARNNLGKCLAIQGLMQEAINQFSQAIGLDPNYLEARYNLGMAYMSERRLDEAIAEFGETLRINPRFRPAEIGLKRASTLKAIPGTVLSRIRCPNQARRSPNSMRQSATA